MMIEEFNQIIESKTGKPIKKSGMGYSACCPAHDDTTPSLSISQAEDGKMLIKCFAGCSTEDICSSLGIRVADLFPEKINQESISSTKRTTYPYHDEQGAVLFSKIRIEPGSDGKPKNFFYERYDNAGNVVKNLNGCRRVLYRLPELIKAIHDKKTVFLVEGEKDANKLMQCGLIATTAPESLKWSHEFTEVLKDADVVILYDMDKTGIERKDLLCKNLSEKTKRLRIVDLPGLEYQDSHGKDISDWLLSGHTTEEFLKIVEKTPDHVPYVKKNKITAISMEEFLNLELPKREMLIAPFLPTQGLCLLYAKRGVGKTHVALGIAYAIASGGEFLKWRAPNPKKVIYVDGEMPAIIMQERLKRIFVTQDLKPPSSDFLKLITPDLQEGPMPDLSTTEGRILMEELIEDRDLIIIDNISTLFRSGTENEAESWEAGQEWALDLRRKGKSVLFIHHAGKGGQQRGTSKKEDILDAVISLKHPEGYSADQGACFEVNFEKTRHFAGADAASFQVSLQEQEDGLWVWEINEPPIDSEVLMVAEKIKDGLTIEKISQLTNLTKSQIETRKKKAKKLGLI